MKKDITIKIPDNLTPEQEVVIIAKRLQQKVLASGGQNKEQKRIGDELNITHLETNIKIIRENREKPITFCKCNICGRDYQSDTAVFAHTNYGGTLRKIATCSTDCVTALIEMFPGRTASTRKALKPVRLF